MMRGEVMSAGQANVPPRKILTAANAPDSKIGDDQTRNSYLNTMLEGYQNNPPKHVSIIYLSELIYNVVLRI